jgi:hypothetical protein
MSGAIVHWDALRGALVGPDGAVVTDAQARKAERILQLGLLSRVRVRLIDGSRVDVYECRPLPACSMTYTLTHARDVVNGVVTRQAWTCGCQAARGTRKAAPRECSHILALKTLVTRTGAST